jgi:hypothetical protein
MWEKEPEPSLELDKEANEILLYLRRVRVKYYRERANDYFKLKQ